MSEVIKTVIFVAVAAVVGVGAYLARPAQVTDVPEEEINQPLFEDFNDPLMAESMEITRYDAERNQVQKFEVAKTPQGWKIVTKGGYPANATEQMANAANSLVGLNVLQIVTDSPAQHGEYGVIEPTSTAASASTEGVGQLVTIKDKSNRALARLVIGVADKGRSNLRYVRVPGRDRVYLVELDPTVFSTEFSDWINKDLLGINPFDVNSLRFRNYTLQIAGGRGLFLPEMDATVHYDAESSQWNLVSLQEASAEDRTKLVEAKLAEGQLLNTEQLNEVRNALDDLTIVDVYRKPDQLANALRSEEVLKNIKPEDLPTLVANGFYPLMLPGDAEPQIVGFNGELVIETQDAVRYRLLFGNEQLGGEDKNQKQRFLFVQTERVDEMLPPPELQEVPEIKEGEGEDVEAQAKQREAILQANDQAMTAYREKVNAADRKIFELNARFADWYYVVAEEDFEKILISRSQLTASAADSAGSQSLPGGGLPGLDSVQMPNIVTSPDQPPVRSAESMQDAGDAAEATPSEASEKDEPAAMDETPPPMPAGAETSSNAAAAEGGVDPNEAAAPTAGMPDGAATESTSETSDGDSSQPTMDDKESPEATEPTEEPVAS